ncbi:FkbM family methyltransferase [Spirosoma arcticum]
MAIKQLTKKFLQATFGLRTYLYYFSIYKIHTLRRDSNEKIMFKFLDLIPRDSLILDVGANLGFITYHLSQKQSCSVIAFEPIPINYSVLTQLIATKKLTNITALPYALGEETGTLDMVMPLEQGVPMQGLSHVANEEDQEAGYRFTVPVKRLDELPEIHDSGKRVGGIKIDVENYEYFILQGGIDLIRQHKPVICVELWENEYRERSLSLLMSLGYVPHILVNDALVPLVDSPAGTHTVDFICLMP